jgi:hypothetical protein
MDAMVLTDGLACFRAIAAAGMEHQPLATGGRPASVELPEMNWVDTIIGNVKGATRGSYRAVSGQPAAFASRSSAATSIADSTSPPCSRASPTPPSAPRRCPSGCSGWLRLIGNQEIRSSDRDNAGHNRNQKTRQ